MIRRFIFAALFTVAACGDNLRPYEPDEPELPPVADTVPPVLVPVPDAAPPDQTPSDARVDTPPADAGIDTPRCCVGALNGNVPLECGPPPGKCARFRCDGVEMLVCRGVQR